MEIALTIACFDTVPMKRDEWIDAHLKRIGRGAAAKLADRLGKSPDVVSKMRSGIRQPHIDEMPIIEEFFGEAAPVGKKHRSTAPSKAAPERTVPVVGYVGAGASAHYYEVSQGALDEAPAPMGATEKTVAVEIRGDSMGTLFDRWYVYYDDVRSPVTADLIGRLCVCGLDDGRILIKKIQRGKTPGAFDLLSEREDPIRNATLSWAARVKIMSPK